MNTPDKTKLNYIRLLNGWKRNRKGYFVKYPAHRGKNCNDQD